MPKEYRVTELSYINGRLYAKGEVVTLEIDSPGRNLELVAGVDPLTDAAGSGLVGPFKAKHIAGGAYAVINADGDEVGDRFLKDGADAGKAKADAMAKADELNKAAASVAPGGDYLPPGGATGSLPDA